jgi:predicted nucleotidyltransferase
MLTTAQLDALRAVQEAYPDARMALIGAAALALHLPMEWRTTADIDLVVAISIADLTALLGLPGWKRDANRQQRWVAPNGVLVDLIPASPEALGKRELVWPNGHVMNLGGIPLALRATPVALAEGVSVPVPSVPVIALLKMAAYLDRPSERDKDLKDLTHIWDSYPPAADDRFFSEDIASRQLDEPRARAFILGAELRAIVDQQDAVVVEHFLERTAEGHGWARLLANSPWRFFEQNLQDCVDAFRDGFQAASVSE